MLLIVYDDYNQRQLRMRNYTARGNNCPTRAYLSSKRVVGLVGNKMSLLLLGLVLSLASAQSSVVNSCSGRGSCQRYLRPLAPSDSTGDTSEDRVLGRLLCHLECLDSVRDQVRLRIAREVRFSIAI